MRNDYPELPKLAFQRTTVPMEDVVSYLKALDRPAEVRRTAYIMFRNESANGSKGINNNYAGFQADSGRWDPKYTPLFAGTVQVQENGPPPRPRLFLAFRNWRTCVDMLCDRVQDRGLYIGGHTHFITRIDVINATTLARAYLQEWAHGSATYPPTAEELAAFASMYAQAVEFFRDGSGMPTLSPNRAAIAAAPLRIPAHQYTTEDLNAVVLRGEHLPLSPSA